MSVPFIQSAFTLGEMAPGLFGRVDLARSKVGASTMRNGWPKFSGGYYSRAGTLFVGFSKQTGRNYPPRLLPFQFSIEQGLELEFGNFYMRIVSNGAYVTEEGLGISGITRANPAVVTYSAQGATAATPVATGVTQTYIPSEDVTLAGGVGIPAILNIVTTQLVSAPASTAGVGNYAPTNTITLAGGTFSAAAVVTVATTKVVSATVAVAGAGGTAGTQTVTGTTGTGTRFQARVTIAAGAITVVQAISVAGSYTVNPTVPANEPVTGAGLAGAELNVVLGVATVTVTTPGSYTVNPTGGLMTQSATSGTGTGAQFSPVIMGPLTATIVTAGAYSSTPVNPAAQQSSTGDGLGATFTMTYGAVQAFNVGDWLGVSEVNGMTQVNGQVYVVSAATATTVTLSDVYGNAINSTAFGVYSSGGLLSRIYTVTSPYSEQDLKWLKFTQSADVMSICCVNQETLTAYQPQDLARRGNTDWVFNPVSPAPTVDPPAAVSGTATAAGTTYYAYVVTAVNPVDKTESIASSVAYVDSSVNVTATAGTITLSWSAVTDVEQYNIYKAPVTFSARPPTGVPFGIIGQSTGLQFADSGLPPDFSVTPPLFFNPFTDEDNYPGVVSYFQQRRAYGSTLDQPDTYFFSQPGSFTNFDSRSPTIETDAIIGNPWSVQVDGIQAMVDMPGGLVVLTGQQAWQLTGQGGSSLNPQPITPTTQQAQPQAFNGCNNRVPPVRIDYDILYVQAKGSVVRDLAYQFYQNIYTGIDLTLNSSHLFTGFQISEWAWAEEPYKILWAVRDDGVMLSLTFVKPEGIAGWARHDTDGAFVSVSSVTEQPVDAVYVAVLRQIGDNEAYTIERMDNRIWSNVDECWCVDCGLALGQPMPDATLTISSSNGDGSLSGSTVNDGGSNWSVLTEGTVVDANGIGTGSGAAPTLTIAGGVITAVTFAPGDEGLGYSSPKLVLYDPAGSEGGSGADIDLVLSREVTLEASGAVFVASNVGSMVRAAGGQAEITAYVGPMEVTANIIVPFSENIPDSSEEVQPILTGQWTMTAPVSTVTGLNHVIGATVTGVADGVVIEPQVVSAQGTISLATPASNVVVGIGFIAQLQSLYLNTGQAPSVQGQRKKLAAVTARVEASRGFQTGANQVDGSTLSPIQVGPTWNSLTDVPALGAAPYGTTMIPLGTGDIRVMLPGGFDTKGQIAFQQSQPLPMCILSIISESYEGDTPQTKVPQKRGARGRVAEQDA